MSRFPQVIKKLPHITEPEGSVPIFPSLNHSKPTQNFPNYVSKIDYNTNLKSMSMSSKG